jgi:LuxR family maltose regulon positive regulatory protein
MFPSILSTKLYFPVVRTNIVSRPRLVAHLAEGVTRPLTLVSAPAGFGKTTLLSEWRTSDMGGEFKICWLSLDNDDNDLPRFLTYLVAALGNIKTGIGASLLAALQSSQHPPFPLILTSLINDLNALTDPCVLVLDDYHVVTSTSIHNVIIYLLDHLPAQMHLVILTRADPPLPLSRLRARNQLIEIRVADLQFTTEEASVFLNQIMELDISHEDVAALETRTEGWIAGLQLAALSMQRREDLHSFLPAFTGSHHYIVDYLINEVLNCQPDHVREFLLKTSVLDRMTASLCEAITEHGDGQEMLEKLERDNLFVVPLDDERCWYRYHHLFADLLRARLLHSDPGRIPELLRRASDWHARHGNLESAITFSIRAEDFKQAAVLIERYAPAMTSQGRVAALAAWIGILPEEIIKGHPKLTLALIWVLYLGLKIEQVMELLQKLERDILSEDAIALCGELALWKGIIARVNTDLEQSAVFLRQALELIPKDDHALLGRAHLFLGLTLSENDANGARNAFIRARDIFAENRNIHGELAALYYLSWVEILQGTLVRASLTCRRGLRLSEQIPDWPAASYAHMAMAEYLYQTNQLEQAEEHANQALRLAELGGHADNLLIAIMDMLRIKIARGDWAEAQNLLERAEDMTRTVIPMVKVQVELEHVRILLAQEKLNEAVNWWQQNQVYPPSGSFIRRMLVEIMQARLLLIKGEPYQASNLLAGLLGKVEEAGIGHLAVQILCLQASALESQGRKEEALHVIQGALSAAEPEGNLRPFLDDSSSILGLLRLAQKRGNSVEFISQILAASSNGKTRRPAQALERDILSKRETELLQLIAAGRANKEIASELVISIGTVKRHTVNIFNKLDVKNRTEAVVKARELGLL